MSATGGCHCKGLIRLVSEARRAECRQRVSEDQVVVSCVMLVGVSLRFTKEKGARCHADVLIGSAVDNDEVNGNLIRKRACHLNCLPSYPQSCQRSSLLSPAIHDVGTEKFFFFFFLETGCRYAPHSPLKTVLI